MKNTGSKIILIDSLSTQESSSSSSSTTTDSVELSDHAFPIGIPHHDNQLAHGGMTDVHTPAPGLFPFNDVKVEHSTSAAGYRHNNPVVYPHVKTATSIRSQTSFIKTKDEFVSADTDHYTHSSEHHQSNQSVSNASMIQVSKSAESNPNPSTLTNNNVAKVTECQPHPDEDDNNKNALSNSNESNQQQEINNKSDELIARLASAAHDATVVRNKTVS